MATRQLAQGLASLGRNGDSILMHVSPEEVSGLQAIAKSKGGSLTINPHTGLPEAFSLGGVFKAALPIAAGFALGPGGFGLFNSALTAGLAVGVGAYALTGDPMYGLSAGLGGAGGYGLGSNIAGFGAAAKTPAVSSISEIARVGAQPLANASTIPGSTGVGAFTEGASKLAQASIPTASKVAAPGLTGFDAAAAGAKKLIEPGGFGAYSDYVKSIGGSPGMDLLTVGSPLASGMLEQPKKFPSLLNGANIQSNYKGPYVPQARNVRFPSEQEKLEMAAAGSPEYNYFAQSNPVPGYTYAAGGSITSGGIRDLYGQPDDQTNGATLSQDGYGLGRLQQMYGGGMPGYAGGGPISFDSGGEIPSVYSPSEAALASYAVEPTSLAEVAAIKNASDMPQENPSTPGILGLSALNRQASQATTDPMGRTNIQPMARAANPFMSQAAQDSYGVSPTTLRPGMLGFADAMAGRGGLAGLLGRKLQAQIASAPPRMPTMQDYIRAANRTALQPELSPVGVEQQLFDRVNPQPVQAAQGGIMSLAKGGQPSSGGYLDGPGDGMSDSIPATIAGKQPARLADGEFVIPADVVSHLGNGSTKAGAKHLYKMMDRVRQARTGTKKQGRKINPNKLMPK